MLRLAARSLWNRRYVASLTVAAIALSVALIVGVERLRTQARESFANTAAGVDLIVAPRGDAVQILLSTMFGLGDAGPGIAWQSVEALAALPQVAWTVPMSTGDNHRGRPVVGTTAEYFTRLRPGGGAPLRFSEGRAFAGSDEAVVGARVAAAFSYGPGDRIVNAHGAGSVALELHDEAPFTLVGVLAPTGTAMDGMVFVSLEGFDALHAAAPPVSADPFADPRAADPLAGAGDGRPERVNAVLVGLTTRAAALGVQRAVAEHAPEPLSAVMPALALLELWSITGAAEMALQLMAWAVALAGLLGMTAMLSAALESRRREFAILRSVGATPVFLFCMIAGEALLLTVASVALGLALVSVGALTLDPMLSASFGIRVGAGLPSAREVELIALILAAALAASAPPALRVYRMTLADGLAVRL